MPGNTVKSYDSLNDQIYPFAPPRGNHQSSPDGQVAGKRRRSDPDGCHGAGSCGFVCSSRLPKVVKQGFGASRQGNRSFVC